MVRDHFLKLAFLYVNVENLNHASCFDAQSLDQSARGVDISQLSRIRPTADPVAGRIRVENLTSSGNQTPGCVLPSKTALANAAMDTPTALQSFTQATRCEIKPLP